MFNFLLLFNVVVILNVVLISAEIPDKILCGNEDCTKIIGKGKTVLPFQSQSKNSRILSFKINADVKIYSKPVKKVGDSDLWGVEINQQRGYAYKRCIVEQSVSMVPDHIVDTEKDVPSNQESSKETTPQPTKTYVVEGTTIYDSFIPTESVTQESVTNVVNSNTETVPLQSDVKFMNDSTAAIPPVTSSEKSTGSPIDSKNLSELTPAVSNINQDLPSEVDNSSMEDDDGEVENDEDDGVIEDDDQNEIFHKTETTNFNVPTVEVSTQAKQNEVTQNFNSESHLENKESNKDNFVGVNTTVEEVVEEASIDLQNETMVATKLDQLQSVKEESKQDSLEATNENVETTKNIISNSQNIKLTTAKSKESVDDNITVSATLNSPSPLLQNKNNIDTNDNNIHESNMSDEKSTYESETVTVEPFQAEMPNPQDVNADVVTDNPVETSEYSHNEMGSFQDNLNNIEARKENSNLVKTDNNNLLKKENIGILPVSEINDAKLSTVADVDQLVSQIESQQHEDWNQDMNINSNEFENQNLQGEQPSNYKVDADEQDDNNDEIEEKNEQLNEVENQSTEKVDSHRHDFNTLLSQHIDDELSCSADPLSDCKIHPQDIRAVYDGNNIFKLPNSAILTVLVIAAVTVVTFLWGYMYMEKRGRESNLIGKINDIQKDYLIVKKENEILKDKLEDVESEFNEKANTISNKIISEVQEQLETERNTCLALELQIQNLEKELENSTEVGLELNRMLSEFLNSENGSETLVANVEQLQRQIIEQQGIINTYNENLNMKETENYELRLEVDINNTKVTELQSELNKMALNLLKLEEDKEQSQSIYENDLEKIKEELESKKGVFTKEKSKLKEQLQDLADKYEKLQKDLELKTNEYVILKEGINKIKKLENNGDALKSLLDVSAIQAELLQLRKEKQLLIEQLQAERNKSDDLGIRCQSALQDLQSFKVKYDEADREKVEATTKLQVLDKYFKEREAQLQKELSKQESMWVEKQGEATSTIERIKYMQEELQNYKTQNESLKQEILEQEVQMRSQISVLEKKAHENWVSARQSERKLEEAKQEAAQLRNRLTLRERSFTEEKMHNRVQSPLEQNGELPVSPAHISNDTAAPPSLLFGGRENLAISPPLPGLPFLPPPPGVPFMPPPLGGVPLPPPGFMPPPPSLMPGDHRPPPLGRISSPPLNSRYSPDRPYSPYSRNSPSPTSDDDYDRMLQPPMYRGYNSYNRDDRRDIHRPPPVRVNPRSNKGGSHSSGSTNSNDSLDKINRHNSKV